MPSDRIVAESLAKPLPDAQLLALAQHAHVIAVRTRLLCELNRSARSERHLRLALRVHQHRKEGRRAA